MLLAYHPSTNGSFLSSPNDSRPSKVNAELQWFSNALATTSSGATKAMKVSQVMAFSLADHLTNAHKPTKSRDIFLCPYKSLGEKTSWEVPPLKTDISPERNMKIPTKLLSFQEHVNFRGSTTREYPETKNRPATP